MPKKNTLLFLLSLILILTGCTDTGNVPADSENTDPVQQETIPANKGDTSTETTQGSIEIVPPDIPKDASGEEESDNNATENPKEALTKILTELQELDELLNGTD